MSENTFNTEELNSNINSPQYFVDGDGSFRFISPVLSSSNFDGSVPVFEGEISASALLAGMFVQTSDTEFYPVIDISKDDPGLEDSPSTDIIVTYLDNQNDVQEIIYSALDTVTVRYENWDEKYLGDQGWSITYGGNAIFSNVAVRGRIEATEGSIDGDLTLGGSFTASTDIGFVKISASGILGATASGLFHLDTATGEIDLTGNITATSGQIKSLNIGPNNYPIIDIVGINTYSGQFIMRTPRSENFSGVRKLEVNDIFKLNGVISSSSCIYRDSFFNESTVLASEIFNSKRFVVVSASFTSSATYTYLCQYKQRLPGEIGSGSDAYNFSGVTASSGSFNIGYLYFGVDGNYTAIDPIAGVYVTAQEGIIFEAYKTGEYPDYIDLSGRFKLGGGKLTYDDEDLTVLGGINATSGSISGNLTLLGSLTASTNSGQLILSSSGLFGSTASGNFKLDSITGVINTNSIRINSNRVITASSLSPAYAIFQEETQTGVSSNFGLNLYHDIVQTNSGSSINYSFFPGQWRTLAHVPGYSGRPQDSNPLISTYLQNPTMRVGSNNTIASSILLRNYAIKNFPQEETLVPGEAQMIFYSDFYSFSGGILLALFAAIDHAAFALTNNSFFDMYTPRLSASTYTFFQATSDFSGTPDFEFKLRGDGRGFADGAWTTPAADYAEYFEWDDGNINNEDRRGFSVVLINGKIKIADQSDDINDIIGVVSSNPGIIGDNAWNYWHNKYLRDEYNNFIYEPCTLVRWLSVESTADGQQNKKNNLYHLDKIPEGVVIPDDAIFEESFRKVLNPEFDSNKVYIPREERKEWDVIGLIGKLRVRSDQIKNPSWKFIKRISDNVEEWLIR